MGGILGYIGKKKINVNIFNQARDQLIHRGPNWGESKFYRFNNNNIFFGHRRLSIIDISKNSNQPFEYKNLSLIFNGEIYNYIELKNILKNKGYNFKTNGDTEVLIKSIHYWGTNVFKHLDGMWAFSCFNKKTGETIISRDRFGEKPLYYFKDTSSFFFCSEIAPILALNKNLIPVNHDCITRFCVNGYKSLKKKNETFYKNILELLPGCFMKIKDGRINIKKYWNPKFEPNNKLQYNDIIENIREKLINSVKLKLRSDVKLAFTLSGGVDSSTLVSISKKILNQNVSAFSILNNNYSYDEKKFIEFSKKDLKINHSYVKLENKNFISDITRTISDRKMPILTISHYLYGMLTKKMSQKGFKVVLSGFGADEIFTGYYDHYNLFLHHLNSRKLKKYKEELKLWKKYVQPYVRNPYLKKSSLYSNNIKFRSHIYLNNNIFKSMLKNNWSEDFFEKKYTKDLLRNRMLNETFNEIIPISLMEEDMQSMQSSMENRSPFLDKNIFEFMLKVPTKHLISSGYSKKILRDSMTGIVDERILWNRKKIGFNAPIKEIFDFQKKDNQELILDNSEIFNYFDRNKIEKIFYKRKDSLPNSLSKFIFNFISCKIFLENKYIK